MQSLKIQGWTGMTKHHEEIDKSQKSKDVTAGWGLNLTMLGPNNIVMK